MPKEYQVFNQRAAKELLDRHHKALKALRKIEVELNRRFFGMQEPIRALVLSVLAREPLLLVGDPGTGKSKLIREFCKCVGVDPDATTQEDYFEYLLTQFTEPSELFGFFDIGALVGPKRGATVLKRMDTGMMQNAKVIYLDEVFNASSAILNTLLAFMNERKFHDRGERTKVDWFCLMGASNRVPDSGQSELRALYDRFFLRCHVSNVLELEPNAHDHAMRIGNLLTMGWKLTYTRDGLSGSMQLLSDLDLLRADIETHEKLFEPADDFVKQLTRVALGLGNSKQHLSNRRLVKLMDLMLLNRLYEAANEPRPPDALLVRGGSEFGREFSLLCYMLERQDAKSLFDAKANLDG